MMENLKPQNKLRVTFDQNVFRKIMRYPSDNEPANYLYEAILDGRIEPLVSQTLFSLEGVTKVKRPEFLRDRDSKMITTEKIEGNRIRATFCISPNHSTHPGMHPAQQEDLDKALSLGFKLIHIPRIGSPLPEEVRADTHPDIYDKLTHYHPQHNLGGAVLRIIEESGSGYSHVKFLFERIERRAGRRLDPKTDIFDETLFNENERNELKAAVAEWSDGDSVAAHVRHLGHIFCTSDKAGKAGAKSVFSNQNRKALSDTYAVQFLSPEELVAKLKSRSKIF